MSYYTENSSKIKFIIKHGEHLVTLSSLNNTIRLFLKTVHTYVRNNRDLEKEIYLKFIITSLSKGFEDFYNNRKDIK